MLSGQYDILVDNMWLTEILAIILLILPFFLLFIESKWIFFFYTVSIVANLPLIFNLYFNFSYEAIVGSIIVIVIIKDVIKERLIRYQTTKENMLLILMLIVVIGVNLFTSIFNFNANEFLIRLFIYIVNIFILGIFTYYFKISLNIKFIKNGFLTGAIILIVSMIFEMIYGHFYLNIRNMRPAGLLLDPNVCAFVLNLALILSFIERKKGEFALDLLMISIRVLIIFGIFLTVSRSAYIGTIFILIALAIYYSSGKKKWIVPSVVIVFIVMYLVFNKIIMDFIKDIYQIIDLDRIFPNNSGIPNPPGNDAGGGGIIIGGDYSNSRLTLIKVAFIVFSNNFITGVGIGNVTREIAIVTGLEMNAHNLFLQLIAESGILMIFALLLLLYYLVVFIFTVEKKYKYIIFILVGLIGIESIFNHNLLNINIFYLTLSIILGLAMLSSKDRKIYTIGKGTFKFRKDIYK